MTYNVVLLQPRVGDMDAFRDRPTPPLGLLSIASGLEHCTEVRVVDQRIDEHWRARLADAVDSATVAVGISTMTGEMLRYASDAALAVRSIRDVPLVWGGVHPSLLPEQTVRHPLVDYVVEGEGEEAFPALVRVLASGQRPASIPGVWSRVGDTHGGTPAPLIDLGSLRPVPYHWVDMERYIGRYRGRRMFFYQGSRGCPYHCSYCYNNVFNRRRWRARDGERVLEDLRALRARYDFDSVYFLDDDFFIDLPRAFTVLSGMRQMGLASVLQGVDLRTLTRLSDIELDLLEQYGVERISLGVESGSDRVRSGLLHKWGSVETVKSQLLRLVDRRFLVLNTFIVGFPGETTGEIRQTLELAMWTLRAAANFRIPQIYNYVPYPGTELFDVLKDAGARLPESLEGWSTYQWDNSIDPDPASRARLERVAFLSKFLDRKDLDYGFGGPLLRWAYRMYRPMATLRIATGLTAPLPERRLYDALSRSTWTGATTRDPVESRAEARSLR